MDALDFLAACVREATGRADLPPREGQQDLTSAIDVTFATKTRMLGVAPTGSGKGLSYLSVAALRAAQCQERTVVSTESIALQTQLVTKDLPAVAAACASELGHELTFALVKGRSNYVDPLQLMASLGELGGDDTDVDTESAMADQARENLRRIEAPGWKGRNDLGGVRPLRALLRWALEQLEEQGPADRHSCPVELTDRLWQLVSASAGEGTTSNDVVPWPAPVLVARERAAEADIVVTNHSMLGVQAAKGVPVLLSNSKLGTFHNIAVDEGHALPGKVRDQGASQLSSATPKRLYRALGDLYPEWDPQMQRLLPLMRAAEQEIAAGLRGFLHDEARLRRERGAPRTITEREPLPSDVFTTLGLLANEAVRLVSAIKPAASSVKLIAAHRRAANRVDAVQEALEHVEEPTPGFAVWAEEFERDGISSAHVKVSPVQVGPAIESRLWHVVADDADAAADESGKVPLGVALVSATLPDRFGHEVAIAEDERVEVPSPFEEAFAGSAYFVPRTTPNDAAELARVDWRSREPKMGTLDTAKHAVWCTDRIVRLVRANEGSALVLSATTSAGKAYAAVLRESLPEVHVHEQWTAGAVQAWREDEGSVLVGTRSLMTGVDAPGETCSLVIIDRIPRAAPNPVDDARVRVVQQQRGLGSYWDAQQFVYVSDASLLLQQAVGRLIRSSGDRGMVAVLDPRMHRGGAVSAFGDADWKQYRRPTIAFGTSVDELDPAVEWLISRRSSVVREVVHAAS